MSTRGLARLHQSLARTRRPAGPVLSDSQILGAVRSGDLEVTPFDPEMIRPAALSLRLGSDAAILSASEPIDARDDETYPGLTAREPDAQGRLVVNPNEVLLASTLERVAISNRLTGILDGISDVARLGISVVLSQQVSPGYGSPDGAILTLEIVSRLPVPVILYPGTRICNLMLMRCGRAANPYPTMPNNHSRDTRAAPSNWAAFHPQEHSGN
jgi:dCTP deaminase